VAASPSPPGQVPRYWPSARHFTEVIQCPSICFSSPALRQTLPAVDRLGMPIVTSGQFAYVYKLKSTNGDGDFAVRCFRGYLGDRDQRYRAIQDHVRASPVPYLSTFTYASEGILVGGQRFPILFMHWIEGPTLDLYIGEMLHRRDVLLHLSEEWLRVVGALQASGIAHGDLQHGNVIVEHGQLRLIDHDGIFVTSMNGWSACEIGHQHYQHPRRTARQFDSKLDDFSALVIYLSLLSLAERPGLWAEYHDENLLFTKSDFQDPSTSTLFAKIREIGGEHLRLADVLATAAVGPPSAVPRLLDLVQTNSRLPAWMVAPAQMEATTKTREVIPAEPPQVRDIRWISWQEKSKERHVPATPGSPAVQSVFSANAQAASPVIQDPALVRQNTIALSKDFFRRHFFWWYWGAYLMFQFSGLSVIAALSVATVFVVLLCFTYGLYHALEAARNARLRTAALRSGALTTAPPLQHGPALWQTLSQTPVPSPITNRTGPYVGNRVLGIYHSPDCGWVDQISSANVVGFATASDALSHGFKPCRICSPAS
jgi:predicted Ser/Thr protein kinase